MAWKTSCVTCPHYASNGTCGELYKVIEHGREIQHLHMNPYNGRVIVANPTLYFCRLHPALRVPAEIDHAITH